MCRLLTFSLTFLFRPNAGTELEKVKLSTRPLQRLRLPYSHEFMMFFMQFALFSPQFALFTPNIALNMQMQWPSSYSNH